MSEPTAAFRGLLDEDVKWLVRRLPNDVRETLIAVGEGIFVAGGFIRACIAHEPVNDVDLFMRSPDAAKLAAAALAKSRGGTAHETDNALTVRGKPPVQFIHRWTFQSPDECVTSFDFTIARAAVWHSSEGWQSTCDPRFYADLAAKRLTYCSPVREEAAAGSLLRVLKFYQRGYRIPLDSLADVMGRVFRGINEETRLANAPGGLERVILGMLHEVDPLVDLSHAAHLPSSRAIEGEAP